MFSHSLTFMGFFLAGGVAVEFKATNPGGGGAFNSPLICSQYWLVGSDLGGLYISEDEGDSWRAVGSRNGGLTSTHISSLACSTTRLIVGSDDGIFVGNLDGTELRQTYDGGYIGAVAVSDGDFDVIYAARHETYDGTTAEILRSSDGGQSFSLQSTMSFLRVVGMRTHPVDSDAVWIIGGEGRFGASEQVAYLSTNKGVSLFRMDPNRGHVVDLAYAWDRENLNRLFLTTIENGVGHVFESPDTGFGPWTEISDFDQTGVILTNKDNPNHVRLIDYNYRSLTSETIMWETHQGGNIWKKYSNVVEGGWSQSDEDWGMGSSFQGSLQTIGYRPDRPSEILWTNSQFVYASLDGGSSWHDVVSSEVSPERFLSRGIDNVVPVVLEISKADPALIFVGYLDLGIWRSDNAGKSWKELNPGEEWTHNWGGKGGNTISIVTDPDRSEVVWAQVAGDLDDPLHLLMSTNRGDSWIELSDGLPPNPRKSLESIALDPESPVTMRRLFVIVDGDVFRSEDDGFTWELVLTCQDCIGISHTDEYGMVAFGPSGVWRSINRGSSTSWQLVSLNGIETSRWTPYKHWLLDHWTYVGPIGIASRNSDIWIAVQDKEYGGIFYSSGFVGQWDQVYSNGYIRSVSVEPLSGQLAVGSSSALTSGGYNTASQGFVVHQSGYYNSGWTTQNDGLAWPFCTYITETSGQWWIISPGEGVLFDSRPTLTLSPTNPPTVELSFGCFPGTAKVRVLHRGTLEISALRIGDLVHVGGEKFDRVYSFGHRNTSLKGKFLTVESTAGTLTLTPEHLVLLATGEFVTASTIRDGDQLVEGTNKKATTVISVGHTEVKGLFAPFTPSGVIVVDNIVASTFIGFDPDILRFGPLQFSFQWLAHALEFPHRLACHYTRWSCHNEEYTESGLSEWIVAPYRAAQWLLSPDRAAIQQRLIFVAILLVGASFNVLEFMVNSDLSTLLVVSVLVFIYVGGNRARHFLRATKQQL